MGAFDFRREKTGWECALVSMVSDALAAVATADARGVGASAVFTGCGTFHILLLYEVKSQ